MPQEEIFNTRDRAYSAWHRRMSTQRFVGIELAQVLSMIDLDASLYVEYDDKSKEPLALIETAIDTGRDSKAFTVTRNLAKRCSPVVPAFVLFYTLSHNANPADRQWRDIDSFRVRRVWPEPVTDWKTFSPKEWADYLVGLRRNCAARIDKVINRERETFSNWASN